jgi:hypothetical protein
VPFPRSAASTLGEKEKSENHFVDLVFVVLYGPVLTGCFAWFNRAQGAMRGLPPPDLKFGQRVDILRRLQKN